MYAYYPEGILPRRAIRERRACDAIQGAMTDIRNAGLAVRGAERERSVSIDWLVGQDIQILFTHQRKAIVVHFRLGRRGILVAHTHCDLRIFAGRQIKRGETQNRRVADSDGAATGPLPAATRIARRGLRGF